jgi:hypothetical protein
MFLFSLSLNPRHQVRVYPYLFLGIYCSTGSFLLVGLAGPVIFPNFAPYTFKLLSDIPMPF